MNVLGVLSILCQLAPHKMKARGLVGLGESKGLPASWLGPPVCHDAFIRATESPSGNLAMLGGAGLAPGEGVSVPCSCPARCPGSLVPELRLCLCSGGGSLLHPHCFLNTFPPGMSQGR